MQLTNVVPRGGGRSDRSIRRRVAIFILRLSVVSLLSVATVDTLVVVRNLEAKARLVVDGAGGDATEQSQEHHCRQEADVERFDSHGGKVNDWKSVSQFILGPALLGFSRV